jgi:uncharacterized membrane protein
LRVVEPASVEEPESAPVYTGPTRTVPGFGGPVLERIDEHALELPAPSFAGPGGQVEIVVEPRAESAPDPEDPTIEQDIAPAEPADATPSEHDAEEPAPPVEESEPAAAALGASVVWGALTLVSVGLAVFALIVTVLAIAGMDRIL